jgi:hypothetical protein
MKKAQLSITGLIVTFIILVLVIVLLPVVRIVIGQVDDGSTFSSMEKMFVYFFPALMVIAAIAGFFVWNAVARPQ